MRVADYLMRELVRRGVRQVFFLPGGGAMYLVDAAGNTPGLRAVPQLHEQACSIAAEACSRVSQPLGVALVTTGPGATNAITGVTGAWIESVPMLVLSGQVKRADLIRNRPIRQGGVQEVDIVSMVRGITKYAVTIDDPLDVRFHLEKALALATTGRRGPVWLDVPLDVQGASIDDVDALRRYQPEDPSARDDVEQIDGFVGRLTDRLARARRPLLLAGHGVRLSGAAEEFRVMAERLGVPVVTTWNAMDLLPWEHPLVVGRPGVVAVRAPNFAVQSCDLLLAVGCRLDHVVTAYNPRLFARGADKWVVDVDAGELGRHELPREQTLCADARRFITAMLGGLSSRTAARGTARDATPVPSIGPWVQRCQTWKHRWIACDGAAFPSAGPIGHFHLVEALSRVIPPETTVVTGSSGLAVEAFYVAFRNRTGQRVFLTSGLGAMGYGLPAAIGACVGSQRKVVSVESDGSLQLNAQELATLAAQRLPIVMIVMNNAGYASIRSSQRQHFQGRLVGSGPEVGLLLPDPVALAGAYGIPGMRIDDASSLEVGLARAIAQPGPFVCDVRLIPDEALTPKVAAIPQPDGGMVSLPLEDMSPLLPIDELQANMLVPLLPASYAARGMAPPPRDS